MLKLLIADDEKTIRETIRSFINWEALDIEVVGTAKDGIEAYNMILDAEKKGLIGPDTRILS